MTLGNYSRLFTVALLGFVMQAHSADSNFAPEFPRTMFWSAYNLGTTGYNQAVGIGKALNPCRPQPPWLWGQLAAPRREADVACDADAAHLLAACHTPLNPRGHADALHAVAANGPQRVRSVPLSRVRLLLGDDHGSANCDRRL